MELIPVSCNHCGAPIQVPSSARFVTCAHCDSQLAIKSTGSATYTEVLEVLDGRTQRMSEQLEEIALQNELERLDREWDRTREGLQSVDQHGRRSDPSVAGSWFMGLFLGIGGCIAMVVGASARQAGPLVIIGLVAAFAGLIIGVTGVGKAQRFERAKQRYLRMRAELLERLRRAQRS